MRKKLEDMQDLLGLKNGLDLQIRALDKEAALNNFVKRIQSALLQELLDEMPSERITGYSNMNRYGFNEALTQCRAVVERKIKQLN